VDEWTAGVADDGSTSNAIWPSGPAVRPGRSLGGLQSRLARVSVDAQRLVAIPTFAAGAAAQPTDPAPFPPDFAHTVQSGALAARNLLAAMCGRAPEKAEPQVDLVGVTLGPKRAGALFRGVFLTGLPAWTLLRMNLVRAIPRLTQKIGLLGASAGELLWNLRTSVGI
jgi:NADH dehydrogenase FAD-containing subunit